MEKRLKSSIGMLAEDEICKNTLRWIFKDFSAIRAI